tara:strand:+ start:220 stop:525 length:306 start_codon:yes stop_codon:yes gene_type:complete
MSPVCGSMATIPPLTFGYCFRSQILFSFFTKIISPTLNLSKIVFLFGIAHLILFKAILPLTPFKVSKLNPISLISKTSTFFHFKVGSIFKFSIFFFPIFIF